MAQPKSATDRFEGQQRERKHQACALQAICHEEDDVEPAAAVEDLGMISDRSCCARADSNLRFRSDASTSSAACTLRIKANTYTRLSFKLWWICMCGRYERSDNVKERVLRTCALCARLLSKSDQWHGRDEYNLQPFVGIHIGWNILDTLCEFVANAATHSRARIGAYACTLQLATRPHTVREAFVL